MIWRVHAAMAITVVLLLIGTVSASEGDRDPMYHQCVLMCESVCSNPNARGPPAIPGRPVIEWSDDRDLVLRTMMWSCPDNCRYKCMHAYHELRVTKGGDTVKYYGKWPFTRIAGCQEIMSVVFSIANAIPHIQNFKWYRAAVPASYPLRNWWSAYALISINTWLWSTVFHARDFVWTERLDYYCAQLALFISLGITLVRLIGSEGKPWIRWTVMIVVVWLFLLHIAYLQLIHFDYGWNMIVSVTVAVLHTMAWLSWAGYVYCFSKRTPSSSSSLPCSTLSPSPSSGGSAAMLVDARRYAWKIVFTMVGLVTDGLLEVFDFPPIYGLFDAHSIWHGITPMLSYMFYSFLIDDALADVHRTKNQ